MSNPEPGWYPHPAGGLRYFNGSEWTEHRPESQPAAVTRPALGWTLVVLAAFIAASAFLPWLTRAGGAVSKNGFDGGRDGILSLLLALVLAAVGVAIGLRQGYIWAPILAALIALACVGVFLIDSDHVTNQRHASIGYGLWVTGVAAGLAVLVSLAGLVFRSR